MCFWLLSFFREHKIEYIKKTEKTQAFTEKLIEKLNSIHEGADFSDIGNTIGILVAENATDEMLGFEIEDFESGFNHGVSIVDGTHDGEIN